MYKRIPQILFALVLIPFFLVHGLYLRLLVQPLCYAFRPWGVRLLNPLIRSWGVNFLRLGILINRARVRVSGFDPEPGESYLILSNHQSIIDTAILFWLFRDHHIKFVMKQELKWGIPNISPATRLARFAFMDRSTGVQSAKRLLGRFCESVTQEKTGCVMFPEGTRSRDGKLGRFRPAGVAMLAAQLDLPVLVTTIDGTWRAGTLGNVLQNLGGLEVRIHIEPPQPIEPLRQRTRESLNEIRDQMGQRLKEFRGGSDGRLAGLDQDV